MNYDEIAEKILLTLRNHTAWAIVEGKVGEATLEEALALRVKLISAKLKELLRVPEDLEAAVRAGIEVWIGPYESDAIGAVVASADTHERLRVSPGLLVAITEAVAPFCQKPEVPEDLEAAWRNVVPDVIDCLYSLHDPIAQGEVIGKAFTEAVALLLAERDERIELLETTIHLCSGSCRVDYKYPTPESPNED